VTRADDGDHVVPGLAEGDEPVGDEGVALVDERLRAARGELPELLHHHRHHVGVGQVLHPEFLDPAVFGLAGAPSDDGHRE